MILPTQATASTAAISAMQSMLDGIDERRRQDEEAATGQKRNPVTEAQWSAGNVSRRAQERIAGALFGIDSVDPNGLKIQLIERLTARLGIDLDTERSNFSLGRAIEKAIKQLGSEVISDLSKDLGLTKAGISLDVVIAAIKNPYSDDNARLLESLLKQANGGKVDFDVKRVLQRLEDVANPKTLEELKIGPRGYDPTRVEDAQARAERQKDIGILEASEKLEDIQEIQDAVKDNNSMPPLIASPEAVHGEPDPSNASIVLYLGAAMELSRDPEPPIRDSSDMSVLKIAKSASSSISVDDDAPGKIDAEAMEHAEFEKLEVPQPPLMVTADEIGLYKLVNRRAAA